MIAKIVLFGAGGHCRSLIEVIRTNDNFQIIGILDEALKKGDSHCGVPILGSDHDAKLYLEDAKGVVAIGQVKTSKVRKSLYDLIYENGVPAEAIVASTSYVSEDAKIGAGSVCFHKSFVNAGTTVGENCIVNTGVILEHDVQIGDHCHIGPGAIVNGGVKVGSGTFLGSGCVIKEGVSIGENCVIAAGTTLIRDLENNELYKGFK